jgi:hypothetical protein
VIPRRTLLIVSFLAALSAFAQTPSDTFEGVKRIVAFGDIHGDYQVFTQLLRTAQLTNAKNAWIGGEAHLVLPGDYVDRGPDSAKVMDLLMDLEREAQKAGGQVHALLGNHETMDILGDLRYVTKEDFKGYQQSNSKELRDAQMQAALERLKEDKTPPPDEAAWRKKFEDEHPLGWVEHRLAFLPDGKYGKWLRQKNTIIKINDMIFLHGSISAKYAGMSRQEINDEVRAELADFSKVQGGIVGDTENNPMWFRGMATSPETDAGMQALVDRVLDTQRVRHIVIGHTVMPAVLPRFGGKVIAIDVGLAKVMGGPPAFLVVEDSKFYAVHRALKLQLPVNGGNVLEYLRAAAALDPPDSPLRKQLAKQGR